VIPVVSGFSRTVASPDSSPDSLSGRPPCSVLIPDVSAVVRNGTQNRGAVVESRTSSIAINQPRDLTPNPLRARGFARSVSPDSHPDTYGSVGRYQQLQPGLGVTVMSSVVSPSLRKPFLAALAQRDGGEGPGDLGARRSCSTLTPSRSPGKPASSDEPLLHAIEAAALLHDIGKLAIPDSLLYKPGRSRLTRTTASSKHAEIGADLLAEVALPGPLSLARNDITTKTGTARVTPTAVRPGDIPVARACSRSPTVTTRSPRIARIAARSATTRRRDDPRTRRGSMFRTPR
jgi:hypothetical protein